MRPDCSHPSTARGGSSGWDGIYRGPARIALNRRPRGGNKPSAG